MVKAEFLLQFPVVTLDPPAQLGQTDEIAQSGLCGQRGKSAISRRLPPNAA
jgi:hypothetical protein